MNDNQTSTPAQTSPQDAIDEVINTDTIASLADKQPETPTTLESAVSSLPPDPVSTPDNQPAVPAENLVPEQPIISGEASSLPVSEPPSFADPVNSQPIVTPSTDLPEPVSAPAPAQPDLPDTPVVAGIGQTITSQPPVDQASLTPEPIPTADTLTNDTESQQTPPDLPKGSGLKTAGIALGAVAVLALGAGGFYFFQGQNKKPTSSQPAKQPQVFVAQEVTSAERTDLAQFASVWQQASAKNLSFSEYKQLALGAGGRFENVPVLKIGEETLYGNDLNYLALFYSFENYISNQKMSEESLNKIVDEAMTDSTLLQQAFKHGLLTSSPEFYNNKDKNYTLRNEKVEIARQALSDKLVQKISGEMISIWFNNTEVPISVETGKATAKAKIDSIYQKLQSGQVDMKQAGDLIKNDPEIGQKCDFAYQNNAYFVFEDREKGEAIFNIQNMNDEAWALGEGQMSKVILAKDAGEGMEYLYAVIKVSKRSGESKTETTTALQEELKDQAPKENLNI